MNEDTLVTGTTGSVEATPASTPAEGVGNPTSLNTPDDAQLTVVDEYREQLERMSADLNAMKSTFQKRESQLTREWQQREQQYMSQLEQLKLSTMDDDERKAYESTAAIRRLQEMEEAVNTFAAQSEEAQSMLKAQKYFLEQGVPADRLDLDEGYDSLWHSGMAYLTEELQNLRKRPASAQSTPNQPVINAPAVVTTNNAPASVGPTWSDLKKIYGSEEEIYRAFETGQLSADNIPAIGKL